ncbi:MAG: glycosyltransferase [Planctomycetaceae bacterium]|nr:glycosyltransferase [Planctomycetaceae bacterium]
MPVKQKKILHIISSLDSFGIGSELTALTGRLPDALFSNEICNLADTGLRCLFRTVPHAAFHAGVLLNVVRKIRCFRPDIVHAWDSTAHFYGGLAALLCRTPSLTAEKRNFSRPAGIVQRFIDTKTKTLIALRQREELPESKTVIVPPAAVPMKHYDPVPAAELLGKIGFPLIPPSGNYYPLLNSQYEPERRNYRFIPPDDPGRQQPFLIGIISPLCTEHRIHDALWIFVTLKTLNLNFHVLIIGDGQDQETLLRCRDRWKLFSRVHFIGARKDVDRLLPCFDALLHLSPVPEQIGSVSAAMSCGIPVVAEETPEISGMITDGVTGMLIPGSEDFRFRRRTAVKKILHLFENAELRRSIKSAAKKHAADQFCFDTAVQKRTEIFAACR